MMKETFLPAGDTLVIILPRGKVIIKATAVHNKSMTADRVDVYPKNADKKTFYLKEKK
ncbi:hypothetical protein ES703_09602 [subsurface metagenome]